MEATEQNVNSETLTDSNIDQAREKESNKTYSQSEADKLVKAQTEAALDKYKDYDETKKELEELKKIQKERELAEMSDLEKATNKNLELEKKLADLAGEKTLLEKKNMKQRILNDPKYAELPSAYKAQVILSDKEEEITESADKQLTQFNEDFKVTKTNFGVPKEMKKTEAAAGEKLGFEAMKKVAAEKLQQFRR